MNYDKYGKDYKHPQEDSSKIAHGVICGYTRKGIVNRLLLIIVVIVIQGDHLGVVICLDTSSDRSNLFVRFLSLEISIFICPKKIILLLLMTGVVGIPLNQHRFNY